MDLLERRIGLVLTSGSLLSTALLALGVAVVLTAPAASAGPILIQTGLMIVMATPIVRVIVSMVGFAQAHEWKFVVMTVAVLGVLAASVIAAFTG
jgi:uncharacterized membrane protein